MELITYFAVAAAAYIGLAAGILLAYANIDELKPGRKYFFMLKKIFFASVIAVCVCSMAKLSILYSGLLAILVLAALLIEMPLPFSYIVLGAAFYISSAGTAFFSASSLIFLFGIPSGTIAKSKKDGKIKKGYWDLLYCLGFFICIILFLI
jgi:hypothetical protein